MSNFEEILDLDATAQAGLIQPQRDTGIGTGGSRY